MRNSANSELRPSGSSRRAGDSRNGHEHAVHFYESDAVLVEAVREFLVAGLEAGEPCIVIATEAHRQAFCLALASHGVDVELARASGRLTLFDARETLEKIVVDGAPDTERFRREAIAIIEQTLEKNRSSRVRLYGEMVDLLWRAGNRSAALQLEELWNDLARDYDYSLLCGYIFGNFYKASDAAHFERICRLHSHIADHRLARAVDSREGVLELTLLRQRASALVHEVEQRKELEESLRQAVDGGRRERRENRGCSKGHQRKRLEAARDADAERTERLMKITAAIAEAVSEEQVLNAIVDQTAAALEASTVGLWVTEPDGRNAVLLRSFGYPEGARSRFSEASLDTGPRFPALDVLRDGKPIFIASQAELLQRYPHLATAVTKGRSYCIACLPVAVEGSRLGALGFTFDDAPPIDENQRKLLLLVARYSGQALARLHLLEADRQSRAHAEVSVARTGVMSRRAELLHGLAKAIIVAERVDPVFEAALDAIEHALGTTRASILVVDDNGVMRFKAWRHLSDEYRSAVEGHSPWSREERAPEPIVVPDVAIDPKLEAYRPLFEREGIGALAFIPLVASGRLVGKFMVYYSEPRIARRAGDRHGTRNREPRCRCARSICRGRRVARNRTFQRDLHRSPRSRFAKPARCDHDRGRARDETR